MAEHSNTHKWTDKETEQLIKLRMELDSDFTGKRNSAKKAWIKVLHRIGLDGIITPNQISKKWDNLKRKYKKLRCPPTGTGTDSGEATAATWPWFSAMYEAIGGRSSIEPPILKDSCDVEVTGSSAVSNEPGLSPSPSVEEREEDSTTSAPSGKGNFHEEIPCTSSGPPPPKKKITNRVLDFLEMETEKEEERFQATHELMQSTSNRFLDLFEQLI